MYMNPVTTFPPELNTLSKGELVAGTQRFVVRERPCIRTSPERVTWSRSFSRLITFSTSDKNRFWHLPNHKEIKHDFNSRGQQHPTDGINHQSSYFIRHQLVSVKVSSRQHLLTEGHNISRILQTPVLMGPKLARSSSTRLHLVHMEGTAMLRETEWRSIFPFSFVLKSTHFSKLFITCTDLTARLFLSILPRKLLQGILQLWEGGNGPVKGWDVQLMDGFGIFSNLVDHATADVLLRGACESSLLILEIIQNMKPIYKFNEHFKYPN
ncbi:hypothetical protein DNTS_009316 [Danionella cerebrum]|uniref:Uncharacterized protein n=1 Tax=Danionella cerebrum TaxID=2873325 RepID=A0A553QSC8_9TELE|nr:hypothetical protein DNTS_009316 [Danionella translucida]